ncbi:MAG: hypothetical protein MMC33_010473 [Icmadophila ericetorum]|nr:hypothetical protein [Icmadophila ericetorum]
MASESDLARCYGNGRALHANIGLKRTQKICENLIAASKSMKRRASPPEGSRDRPIVIDDDEDSPKRTAPTQELISEKHRIRKRARKMRGSFQTIREPVDDFSRLRELVLSSEKIVVISGAGISVSAGFPTFEDMRKSKQTSFDRSLYSSSEEMTSFHSTVRGMCERLHSDLTEPSPFHKNIDCVERLLPDLDAKTARLHGRVDRARCGICNWVCDYEPHLFQGSDSLYCQRCLQRSQARTFQGKRSLKVGRLRPNVLLYGEPHPDDKEILETAEHDLRICPELVLIVGTKLAIPGARSIAADFCRATRSVGGVSFWISKEEPTWRVKALCDYVLIRDCDKVIPLDI